MSEPQSIKLSLATIDDIVAELKRRDLVFGLWVARERQGPHDIGHEANAIGHEADTTVSHTLYANPSGRPGESIVTAHSWCIALLLTLKQVAHEPGVEGFGMRSQHLMGLVDTELKTL
jgi:hypothetical protein